MGPHEISETMTEWKICCLMLLLACIVWQRLFSRAAELRQSPLATTASATQPQHDSKHYKATFPFAGKCGKKRESRLNSEALRFGIPTFSSSLNWVLNMGETSHFFLLMCFKMENIWRSILPSDVACQKGVEFYWTLPSPS